MNMPLFAAFTFLSILILFLPFLGAIREWWKPTVAKPLPLRLGIRETVFFAQRFAASVGTFFKQEIAEDLSLKEGTLPNGLPFRFRGRGSDILFSKEEINSKQVEPLLVSLSEIRIPPQIRFSSEVYSDSHIRGGDNCSYLSVYSRGSLQLGSRSRISQWAHSDKTMLVGKECFLRGRASSKERLSLETDCRFQRLQAPFLDFAVDPEGLEEINKLEELIHTVFPTQYEKRKRRFFNRDLVIPPHREIIGDIVATGTVVVGDGTKILGSLKSHRDIVIGKGALVKGSVVAIGNIKVYASTWVEGPVIGENHITLRGPCVIGRLDGLTTLTCETLDLTSNVRIHGTAWAYSKGQVG